jgi:hypothetical protein
MIIHDGSLPVNRKKTANNSGKRRGIDDLFYGEIPISKTRTKLPDVIG